MKVLFVGLGGIGQRHLRNLLQLEGDSVEIYAYRVRRAGFVLNDKLEITDDNLEQRYNIHVIENLEQAWNKGMDCIFICNPTSLHMDILLQALANNCHIFIEKPISHNCEHMDELKKLLSEKQAVTFVGYQNRFHPCIRKAKEILDLKMIGDIVMASAEIGESVKTWHRYEDYRTMYACRSDLGGGVVLSQIHELDYLIFFFGMPESVYAAGGKLSDLEIDVEDVASIVMKHNIEGKEAIINIREDYLQNPPSRTCKITGTKGRIEFDLLNNFIIMFDEKGTVALKEKYEFQRNDMFLEEMKVFLDEIKGKKVGEGIPVSEGLKSLQAALAVKRSLESGNAVKISEL